MLVALLIVGGSLLVCGACLVLNALDHFEDSEVAHDTDRLDL